MRVVAPTPQGRIIVAMAGETAESSLRESLNRIEKLNEHLDTVWGLPDGDPEKIAGTILACRLQNDLIKNILELLSDEPRR